MRRPAVYVTVSPDRVRDLPAVSVVDRHEFAGTLLALELLTQDPSRGGCEASLPSRPPLHRSRSRGSRGFQRSRRGAGDLARNAEEVGIGKAPVKIAVPERIEGG